jgi:hypothetical protein
MRRTIGGLVVVGLLWGGYVAWPVAAFYDLVGAVRSRDSTALTQAVNFPSVRRSLTEQIVATYLQLTGKDARLGQFGRGMAVAAVTSIADPIVAKLVSAEALVELLRNGWPSSVLPEDEAAAFRGLASGAGGNLWRLFLHSEMGLRSFTFAVPTAAPAERRFKLQFRLTTWRWRLSAIELPEEIRTRLARELAKQIDRK